ncbi:hypothetical protein SCLCIDRAFT_162755 [Scleroderma citrinum Foug A]|uniref:Uncharacterized protein n=1 Tax=Scleroderma citrinum Foug A TaxID=1036808 RepID=A0A0C3ESB0_9AGAM|nr:hypothetical protein SCLCIDRAFT_162755 [Scleroderma citrinum Foug A]
MNVIYHGWVVGKSAMRMLSGWRLCKSREPVIKISTHLVVCAGERTSGVLNGAPASHGVSFRMHQVGGGHLGLGL